MDELERERHDVCGSGTPGPGGAPDSGGGGLERLRRDSDGFLSAGDEAIRRALSGNSQLFLRSVRQHGGE